MASPAAPLHQNYSWVTTKVVFTSLTPTFPGVLPIIALNSITGIGSTNDFSPQRGIGGVHLGYTAPITSMEDFTVDISQHNWHEFTALWPELHLKKHRVKFAVTVTNMMPEAKSGGGAPILSVFHLQGCVHRSNSISIAYGPDANAMSVVFSGISEASGDAITAGINAIRGNLPING